MAIGRPIDLVPNVSTKNISEIATAGQTLFTVIGGYKLNNISVYRNGTRLVDGRDYLATDGATVTLLSPAIVNDVIEFEVFDSFNIVDAVNTSGDSIINGNLTATKYYGDGSELTGVSVSNTLTIGVRVGSAVTFGISGDSFNAIARGGGNIPITV